MINIRQNVRTFDFITLKLVDAGGDTEKPCLISQ